MKQVIQTKKKSVSIWEIFHETNDFLPGTFKRKLVDKGMDKQQAAKEFERLLDVKAIVQSSGIKGLCETVNSYKIANPQEKIYFY